MKSHRRRVTEKRLVANRAAAARSTGPRSVEGKERAAFNSFKHGLYASQDGIIRQAFTQAGLDPAQYDHLLEQLNTSFKPQDPIQALLVEDLARLYWLKNLSQCSLAEWQARQAAVFTLERARRRHEAQRNENWLDGEDLAGGLMWADPCPDKFARLYELFGTLDGLTAVAGWNSEADDQQKPKAQEEDEHEDEEEKSAVESVREAIYGDKVNWTGRQIEQLVAELTEDQAPADDPRVARLRALIRKARQSIEHEEQIHLQDQENEIGGRASADDPALHATTETWKQMVEQEAAFDRQIASKIRLLMKLRAAPPAQAAEEQEEQITAETHDPGDSSPVGGEDQDSGTNPKPVSPVFVAAGVVEPADRDSTYNAAQGEESDYTKTSGTDPKSG